MYKSKVGVVLGAQWGDEGKGKVVDMLALEVDIVCRCQVSKKSWQTLLYYIISRKMAFETFLKHSNVDSDEILIFKKKMEL